MPKQVMMGKNNLFRPIQWRKEGNGLANYAKPLGADSASSAGTKWTTPFQRGYLSKELNPEYEENSFGGDVDKQGLFQIWETNYVTLMGRLLNNDDGLDLIRWASNKSTDGLDGPQESRTFLMSYKDNSGDEVFVVMRGCKPVSVAPSFSKDKVAEFSIRLFVSEYYESDTDPQAADSYSSSATPYGFTAQQEHLHRHESLATPLRFQDLGDFNYDAEATLSGGLITGVKPRITPNFNSMDFTIDWGVRLQESQGAKRPLYQDYGSRSISGNVNFYKQGEALNEEARTDLLSPAWITISKTGTADAHASWESGTTNKLKIFSKLPGVIGNSINIALVQVSGSAAPIIDVRGRDITISMKSTETIANVIAAINAPDDPDNGEYNFARRLVVAGIGAGTASNSATAKAKTAMTGGDDNKSKIMFERFKFNPSSESLIDDVDSATLENKSFQADTASFVIA